MNYKQEYRSLLLQERLGYETARASDMAAKLDGLDDKAFDAHIEKLKSFGVTASLPDVSAPRAAEQPPAPARDTTTNIESVRASIVEYVGGFLGTDEEE